MNDVEAVEKLFWKWGDHMTRMGVGMADTPHAKRHPQDPIEHAHKADDVWAEAKAALARLLARTEQRGRVAAIQEVYSSPRSIGHFFDDEKKKLADMESDTPAKRL